jgi:hypothetical protein
VTGFGLEPDQPLDAIEMHLSPASRARASRLALGSLAIASYRTMTAFGVAPCSKG